MKWNLVRLSWVIGCVGLATCGEPQIKVLGEQWTLHGFVDDMDLSAIARGSKNHCLVVSDEGSAVQLGRVDLEKRRIEFDSAVSLPVEGKREKAENDLEGAAYCESKRAYYVIGSHGLGKKKGEFHENRYRLYEIPVDESGQLLASAIRWTSLLPAIAELPELAPHLKQPLQQDGLNIEGLACAESTLYVGLRAPSREGKSFVLEVALADLWQDIPAKMMVHELNTGDGRGIREIVALEKGFIVLTGNSAAEASKKFPETTASGADDRFELSLWDGRTSEVRSLGILPKNGGKAEGLMVLAESPEAVDLLILYDSLPQGGALSVRMSL